MKRKVLFATAFCTIMLSLTACGHEHVWQDASCIEPQKCVECGETEGELGAHIWKDATCTEPKTCSVCGETEGEALAHTWKEATCAEPKTCNVCGETEGKALAHTWVEANYQQAATCSICGAMEGEPIQSDFDKYGIVCNVVLDQEFDYDDVCVDDANKDTIMKGLFTNYKCFVSDESHEAKEGYVWQTVTMIISVNDYNGWQYGANLEWYVTSYYNIKALDDSATALAEEDGWRGFGFLENYCGNEYDECLLKTKSFDGWVYSDNWNDAWNDTTPPYCKKEISIEFRVPENSEEIVIFLYNPRITGYDGDYLFELNNLDSIEAFRLPVAVPN